MTTTSITWERITDTTYATEDWRMVVERDGDDWKPWLASDRGTPKARFTTREAAMDWSERWLRGEARA